MKLKIFLLNDPFYYINEYCCVKLYPWRNSITNII